MLFVGTSIIHPSTEGVFLLCNILDLLIYSVYYIKRQKGAWGYENILEEKAVTCFPNRNSDFVVLLSEVDEPMVVSTSELTNGERVKLTEKD